MSLRFSIFDKKRSKIPAHFNVRVTGQESARMGTSTKEGTKGLREKVDIFVLFSTMKRREKPKKIRAFGA